MLRWPIVVNQTSPLASAVNPSMDETGSPTRRVRSRSCGAISEAETNSNAQELKRKNRRPRASAWQKRRSTLSSGGIGLSNVVETHFEFHQSDELRSPVKVSDLLPCLTQNVAFHDQSLVNADVDIDVDIDVENSASNCTAIATCVTEDVRACLSVSDLSTVYKSLELLNGYLTLQGYSPYETAFLNDPRVAEILSHIQHGCPLARRPSKHLPSIDSSLLPSIDWTDAKMPLKSTLTSLLVERIHAYIHTDIEVLIGREVYCCHLLVLQCYSTYFDDVNGAAKVHLPEDQVTGRAFHMIYDWMISVDGDAYQLLRRDNVLEVLVASQFLGICELEEQCWSFINCERIFNEETAFLLYMEARKSDNKIVMDLMLPKIIKFFLKLVSTVDFLMLDLGAMCAILGSHYIAVHNEMEVFMAAVLWLTHDWGKRRAHVVEVMKHVRFGWVEPWQIVDIRRNYTSNPEFIRVTQNAEVRRMMEEGLAFATTREACGADGRRLRDLVDALCLTEPRPRHWLEDDVRYESFQKFIEALPKYRDPGALDEMHFRKPGSNPVPPRPSSPPPVPPRVRAPPSVASRPSTAPSATGSARPLSPPTSPPVSRCPSAAV